MKERSFLKRFFAIMLCLSCLFSCMNGIFGMVSIAADDGYIKKEDFYPSDDSLHFILRHWHSEEPTMGSFQGNEIQGSGRHAFAVVEGYIVPVGAQYEFYLVYRSDGDGYEAGDVKLIEASDSHYVKEINKSNGTIVLNALPILDDDGNAVESFSGFSISSGVKAVSGYDNSETVTIKYYNDVHLVKAHAFYIRKEDAKGADDEEWEVIGNNELFNNPEVDTAWVYTYISDGSGHKAGEIVKNGNEAYYEGDELPEGLADDVQLTKFYCTSEGLHTDKTARVHLEKTDEGETLPHDGRTFDIDLEAWYNEGFPVQVGMVLDASGSMAFAADAPTPININDADVQKQMKSLLNATEQAALNAKIDAANKKLGNNPTATQWENSVFLTEDEERVFLNPHNTDNSLLGVSGYTYFVYDPDTGTQEYTPLGYWDGGSTQTVTVTADGKTSNITIAKTKEGNVLGQLQNNSTSPGWYYATHSGDWYENYNNPSLYTGKRLVGIPNNASSPNIPETITALPKDKNSKDLKVDGSGKIYTPAKNTPNRFYIDGEGYLRCFFYRNDKAKYASYVYKLEDEEYVKTESLRRALGAFVTDLSMVSPNSEVSAARFSTAKIPDDELYKQVLLDWTNDPAVAANALNLNRGNGGSQDSNRSEKYGIEQFNYGLTGTTSTFRGIKTFMDKLMPHDYVSRKEDGGLYLIIFTDGKDTDIDSNKTNLASGHPAYKLADELKDRGYTIFTVLLSGGAAAKDSGTGQYQDAETFLKNLSGSAKSSTDKKYFFSTDEEKENVQNEIRGELRATLGREPSADEIEAEFNRQYPNSADLLVKVFSEDILNQLIDNPVDYTVTDYIDPRFDLVDASGIVWHLNKDGKVVKSSGEEVDLTQNVTITISDDSDEEAQTPYLRYNAVKDMYYLEWVNQEIPGRPVGVNRLEVWNATITVKAKDDFIGGNAVLTNGNDKNMNWVYYPDDTDKSSGTGDMTKEYNKNPNTGRIDRDNPTDKYPSKGFPRTTVNVRPPENIEPNEDIIYMGEYLSLQYVINLFTSWADTPQTQALWDYMYRFLNYLPVNKNPEKGNAPYTYDDLQAIFEDTEKPERGFPLQYYYLDDVNNPHKNQTASDLHKQDGFGVIQYFWEVGERRYPDPEGDGTIKDTIGRQSTMKVYYAPKSVEEREADNNKLVIEKDDSDLIYKWKPKLKPAAGEPMKVSDSDDDKDTAPGVADIETPSEVTSENGIRPGEKLLEDTLKRDIVSGEIVMQMEIDPEAINELIRNNMEVPKTITYSANLTRDYHAQNNYFTDDINPDNDITVDIDRNDEVVGYFEAEYTVPDDVRKGEKELTGPIVVNGKLSLTDDFIKEYGYDKNDNGNHKFTSEFKYEAPTYGLPIGTYTLVPDTANIDTGSEWLVFDSIKPFEITSNNGGATGLFVDAENDKWLVTDKQAEAYDYPAPAINNKAYLGTSVPAIQTGDKHVALNTKEKYTDRRYAGFVVNLKGAEGLIITKKSVGLRASRSKKFNFEVTLYTDPEHQHIATDISGKYGDVEFNEGVAEVELKHNESVSVFGLPAGKIYYYKVVEQLDQDDAELYIVEKEGDEGQIEEGKITIAKFVNHSKISLPEAGVISMYLVPVLGGLLLLIAYLIREKKLKTQ